MFWYFGGKKKNVLFFWKKNLYFEGNFDHDNFIEFNDDEYVKSYCSDTILDYCKYIWCMNIDLNWLNKQDDICSNYYWMVNANSYFKCK